MTLWFYGFFSSITSKAFQKSAFPQHFLRSLRVIMSGAVGAGSRGKPDFVCTPAHWLIAGDQYPGFTQRCLFMSLPLSMCPTSAKQPSGAFLGGIGTNPWAVKSWVTSFLSQSIRWASEFGVFFNGEYFTVVSGSLLTRLLSGKKKITILLINLGCTSGAHSVPASWLESKRWVAWCRWSGNLMAGNF